MAEKAVELTTSLSITDCADRFKEGIDKGRGIGSQIGGMVNKLRGATDLEYYTPEGTPFDAADDDPSDFDIGVAIPRLNKQHAHGTNVHMSVWDRDSHRDVLFWAHHAPLGVIHATTVLNAVENVFKQSDASGASQSNSGTTSPPPPTVSVDPASTSDPTSLRPEPKPETEELPPLGRAALQYAIACQSVVDSLQATLDVANRANGARNVAGQRPQHEASINNFTRVAEDAERNFVPLIKEFIAVREQAISAASRLRQMCAQNDPPLDPELALLAATDERTYPSTGSAIHILRTEYGTTPYTFLAGLEVSNQAIQGDIFNYGEDGFQGHVYQDPAAIQQPVLEVPAPESSAADIPSSQTRRFMGVSPASWKEIRSGLLDTMGGVENVTVEAADPKFVALTLFDGASQRSQTVTVDYHEGDGGPDWFRVESGFARKSPEAAIHAAEYVSKTENSPLGVAVRGDLLVLRWTAATGSVSMDYIFSIVDLVAGLADILEEEISGQDEF